MKKAQGKLKITYKSVGELNPYENNPRLNENAVPAVMRSIQEFGFKIPVIIDSKDVLVCGHTRVEAAKRLGMDEVPCIVADDLSDEQIKAFRLADNQVATLAGWDFPKLDLELADLKGLGWDMTDFGFMDYSDEPMEPIFEEEEEEKDFRDGMDMEVSVVVVCPSESDAEELMERMKDEGRHCRKLHSILVPGATKNGMHRAPGWVRVPFVRSIVLDSI